MHPRPRATRHKQQCIRHHAQRLDSHGFFKLLTSPEKSEKSDQVHFLQACNTHSAWKICPPLFGALFPNMRIIMKKRNFLLYIMLLVFSTHISSESIVSGEGVVLGTTAGLFYINGNELETLKIEEKNGGIRLILITTHIPETLTLGETLYFEGPLVTIGDMDMVNTAEGYFYRPRGRTYKEIADQDYANLSPSETGIPITQVLTLEQQKKEKIEFWMALMSIVISVLAIDKIITTTKRLWKCVTRIPIEPNHNTKKKGSG